MAAPRVRARARGRMRALAPSAERLFALAAPTYVLSAALRATPPMSKSLIIAEKPSVAADIARALGGFTRHGDYFESDRHVLSSAVGHLLEIGMPEDEEVKRGKWTFAHLPAIPSKFALKPIEKNESRLKTLLKLIKRKDVTALVNACDAGREGELIFRNIVQYAKSGKPVQRLWLQSMTPAAIRDAFGELAHRRRDAPARRRRRLPLRIGLARRHQRHAGDDGVQLEVRRLPPDDRRPRADADARDPGRARGEDPRVRVAQVLGGAGDVPRERRRVRRPLVRREWKKKDRRPRRPRRAAVGRGTRARARREMRGQARASSPRNRSRRRRARRCSTTSRACSARRTAASASRRAPRSRSRSRSTKSTRRSPIPRTDSRALPEDYIATVKATMEVARRIECVRRLRAAGASSRSG